MATKEELIEELCKEITPDRAIEIAESGAWKEFSPLELAYLQFCKQPLLFCDFTDIHGAIEETVGFPVFTHHFVTMNKQLKEIVQAKWNYMQALPHSLDMFGNKEIIIAKV